jgi:hypothetical protein
VPASTRPRSDGRTAGVLRLTVAKTRSWSPDFEVRSRHGLPMVNVITEEEERL